MPPEPSNINSIQETQASEQSSANAGGKLGGLAQKISAYLDPLVAPLLENPTFEKIYKNKPLFFGILGGVLALIIILIIVLILALSPKSEEDEEEEFTERTYTQAEIDEIVNTPLPEASDEIKESNMDNLIIKGNLLFQQGLHKEAYQVFRKIADFSQSIANYNLGTIQLKNNSYEDSIVAYSDSIETGQNISASSINAAIAALKINRYDLSSHYLNLARDNLAEIANEPFFSYAYALLSYYKGNYFETLSPLLNPNSKDFTTQNARLAAHIFTIFSDDENALKNIQKVATPKDDKTIGLLYARMAQYPKAKTHLMNYLRANPRDIDSMLALGLIDLKLGNYMGAANSLESIASNRGFQEKAQKIYPIKVIINPELFDIALAQRMFWERDFENKDKLGYKMLFYYAPYRVFDAKRALEEISQASSLTHINITEGKNMLLRSSTTSKIDKQILRTLVELESKNLREALGFLQEATKNNPNHAILYYNLGLVLAQLGHYDDAYSHFIRAYYLDQSDYISGIFAVLAGRFSNKNTNRINNDLLQRFYDEEIVDPTKKAYIENFLNYLNDNQFQERDWIKNAKAKEPIYYVLEFIYALKSKNKKEMLENINELKNIYPNDIVANILSILVGSFGDNLQDISISMYNLFNQKSLDLRPLHLGGAFPRELYVYTGFVTGSLQNQARIMQNYLIANESDPRGTMQTLGAIYLYQREFQKAYSIYTTLVDELKEGDSHTRFLAAVSAVGAGNYPDAVLLLQLAKMETPTAYEARYGLGLLYHAANNLKTAALNYNFIAVPNFHSQFFDFQIDTQKIHSYELVSKNNGNPEDNPPNPTQEVDTKSAQNQSPTQQSVQQNAQQSTQQNLQLDENQLPQPTQQPVTNPLLDT